MIGFLLVLFFFTEIEAGDFFLPALVLVFFRALLFLEGRVIANSFVAQGPSVRNYWRNKTICHIKAYKDYFVYDIRQF